MAYNVALSSLQNPQLGGIAPGKKYPWTYPTALAGAGPGLVEAAKAQTIAKQQLDALNLGKEQSLATLAQAAENNRIQEEQAKKAATLSTVSTGIAATALANEAGLINLKNFIPKTAPVTAPASPATSAALANSGQSIQVAGQNLGAETVASNAGMDVQAVTPGFEGYSVGAESASANAGLDLVGTQAGTGTVEYAGGTGLTGANLGVKPIVADAAVPIEGGATTGATAAANNFAWTSAGGEAGAAPAGVLAYPAMAGYLAPKVLDALHEDSTENLGHNVTLGMVSHERTARNVGGGVAGAGAGFLTGAMAGAGATSWTGPGAIVGAIVGGIAGVIGSECIIVTACTSSDSEEVNISREYRDKFLTVEQLRGYYCLASICVPLIVRHAWVKRTFKKHLVDHLISYGRWSLGKGPYPGPLAGLVTRGFLSLCGKIGKQKTSFVRCNGEII